MLFIYGYFRGPRHSSTYRQQRGFSAQQAEGIADALRELDANNLASKSDLQDVRIDLIRWIVGTQLAYGAIIVGVLFSII